LQLNTGTVPYSAVSMNIVFSLAASSSHTMISGGIVDARFYDRDVIRMTHDDLHHFRPISASMFDPDAILVAQLQAF
jgi:hypothetical protein